MNRRNAFFHVSQPYLFENQNRFAFVILICLSCISTFNWKRGERGEKTENLQNHTRMVRNAQRVRKHITFADDDDTSKLLKSDREGTDTSPRLHTPTLGSSGDASLHTAVEQGPSCFAPVFFHWFTPCTHVFISEGISLHEPACEWKPLHDAKVVEGMRRFEEPHETNFANLLHCQGSFGNCANFTEWGIALTHQPSASESAVETIQKQPPRKKRRSSIGDSASPDALRCHGIRFPYDAAPTLVVSLKRSDISSQWQRLSAPSAVTQRTVDKGKRQDGKSRSLAFLADDDAVSITLTTTVTDDKDPRSLDSASAPQYEIDASEQQPSERIETNCTEIAVDCTASFGTEVTSSVPPFALLAVTPSCTTEMVPIGVEVLATPQWPRSASQCSTSDTLPAFFCCDAGTATSELLVDAGESTHVDVVLEDTDDGVGCVSIQDSDNLAGKWYTFSDRIIDDGVDDMETLPGRGGDVSDASSVFELLCAYDALRSHGKGALLPLF